MQQSTEDKAIETARRYAQAMNAWERDFEQEWSAHAATYTHGAPEHTMAAYRERDRAIQDHHRSIYRTIFQRYATDRARAHGGPDAPLSAGFPTKYAGIDAATPAVAEVKRKNRIEVTFDGLTPANPGRTRFVLLRMGEEWRIDSFAYQFAGEDTWRRGIL